MNNVIMAFENRFFCLKMDFIKNQSDIFDEVPLSWVKVSKKRFH